jgi:hypothetical protein
MERMAAPFEDSRRLLMERSPRRAAAAAQAISAGAHRRNRLASGSTTTIFSERDQFMMLWLNISLSPLRSGQEERVGQSAGEEDGIEIGLWLGQRIRPVVRKPSPVVELKRSRANRSTIFEEEPGASAQRVRLNGGSSGRWVSAKTASQPAKPRARRRRLRPAYGVTPARGVHHLAHGRLETTLSSAASLCSSATAVRRVCESSQSSSRLSEGWATRRWPLPGTTFSAAVGKGARPGRRRRRASGAAST